MQGLSAEMPEGYGNNAPETDQDICNAKSNELLALLRNIEMLRVSGGLKCLPFIPDFLGLDRNPALKLRELYSRFVISALKFSLFIFKLS